MEDRKFKAIKSKKLSTNYDARYVIVSTETGEILDDAQGWGYKSQQKAYAAYAYKSRGKKAMKAEKEKKRAVRNWISKHPTIADDFEDVMFEACKSGTELRKSEERELLAGILEDHDVHSCPFSLDELLKYW